MPTTPANARDQQSFSEELPHNAQARCAERKPRPDFVCPGGNARQEERRDVRAGDQEDEDRRRKQQRQSLSRLQPQILHAAGCRHKFELRRLSSRRGRQHPSCSEERQHLGSGGLIGDTVTDARNQLTG